MISEKTTEQASAGGVWQGFPYEQIIDDEGEARFLVYRKNPLLDKQYEKTGDWKTYYMAEKYLDDSEKGITLVPRSKVAWELTGSLPEKRISHNNLWAAIKSFLIEHLDLSDKRLYDILVSWIMSTYVLERWQGIPYLFFLGPVKSGKTRALECLQHLCYRGVLTSNISTAALYRLAEDEKPTILLDETEIYHNENRSDILGILNSGYRRGQQAIRCGEDGALIYYDTFCFKALAGTKDHKETLVSRSIVISMYKATRKVNLFLDTDAAKKLRMHLLLWRMEQLDELDAIDVIVSLPKEVGELREIFPNADGRFLEKYYPLITVSNSGRQQIIDYGNKMVEIEQYADENSIEAEITQVLINCKPLVYNNVLKNKDIADNFNMNRDDREKWKTRTITTFVRRLGFHAKRATDGQRGYFYDAIVLDGLCKRYNITNEPSTLGEPSIASITSNPVIVAKDRIVTNINEDRCSICHDVPEVLYPDINREYLVCRSCKQREGEEET